MASHWSRLSVYPAFGGVRSVLVSTPFTEISLVNGTTYFLPDRRQGTADERGELGVCEAHIRIHEDKRETDHLSMYTLQIQRLNSSSQPLSSSAASATPFHGVLPLRLTDHIMRPTTSE